MSEEKNKSLLHDILKSVIAGIILSSITWLGYHFIGKKLEAQESTQTVAEQGLEKEGLATEKHENTRTSNPKDKGKESTSVAPPTVSEMVDLQERPEKSSSPSVASLEKSKKLLSSMNDVFEKWSLTEWSFDTYIDESVNIEDISVSELNENAYTLNGDFNVNRRFRGIVNVAFYSKLVYEDGQIIIEKVCYRDRTINDEKCCSPKKWSLQRVRI